MEKQEFENEKGGRGGARPGAGRPKSAEPRKAHSFSCTDAEAETLKKLLEFLRAYPELIGQYVQKAVAKNAPKVKMVVKKKPELQWLESEEERLSSLKKPSGREKASFQWLESEEEEQTSTAELAERIKRSVDTAAKGVAEIIANNKI